MYTVLTIIAVVVSVLVQIDQTDAECCSLAINGMCADKIVGAFDFCCGVGSCNIFCCNCDGGCIDGTSIPFQNATNDANIDLQTEN